MNDAQKAALYEKYYPKVFAYLRSRLNNIQDAEDLAQNVFMKVYSKIDTFDDEKSSISTWIYTITHNTLIDRYKSRSNTASGEIPITMADEDTLEPLDSMMLAEQQEALADALEKLNQDERDLIILCYFKEYSLTKIADMMRLPYGRIKRLHMKALNNLKLSMMRVI